MTEVLFVETLLPSLHPLLPRRSREVIHLCSDRVTHAKNRPCPWARSESGDFIRAEGAQGLCIPPKRAGCQAVLAIQTAHLPCAKSPFWWVTFREQTWITSRERRSPAANAGGRVRSKQPFAGLPRVPGGNCSQNCSCSSPFGRRESRDAPPVPSAVAPPAVRSDDHLTPSIGAPRAFGTVLLVVVRVTEYCGSWNCRSWQTRPYWRSRSAICRGPKRWPQFELSATSFTENGTTLNLGWFPQCSSAQIVDDVASKIVMGQVCRRRERLFESVQDRLKPACVHQSRRSGRATRAGSDSLVGVQEVPSSNLGSPTNIVNSLRHFSACLKGRCR